MILNRPIRESAFRRLVAELTPEELLKFPTASLPLTVPIDAADFDTEPEKRAALERLVWRAAERDMAQCSDDLSRHGKEVNQALDVCQAENGAGTEELCRLCDRLVEPCQGANLERDPLSDEHQLLDRARDRARALADRLGRLSRALAVIDGQSGHDNSPGTRLISTRRQAKEVLSRMEWALGRFHMLELDVACAAMRDKSADCDLQRRRIQDFDERIAALETQLERDNGMVVRLLRPETARQQREARMARLQMLRRKRDSVDILIDEQHLLRWLDVLVNMALFTDQAHWHEKARKVRQLLYRLLNTYCMQQELAAHQVATRAVPGVDGRKAIGYYLASEEFILNYFARKRREVTQWLSDAAESKLAQLDRTRKALLAEYRHYAAGNAGAEHGEDRSTLTCA